MPIFRVFKFPLREENLDISNIEDVIKMMPLSAPNQINMP